MQDPHGLNQQQGAGHQHPAGQAPQTWQFVRPGQTPPMPVPNEAGAQPSVSAFQFVRPQPAQESSQGSFDASSEEFSRIIDRKIARTRRNRRRSFMVTMILLFGSTAGGTGWFVSNPDRVTAFKAAFADLKSATDVHAMKAKYDAALAKIGSRKGQIDEATSMMGIDPTKPVADGDASFDKEMKEMMGDDAGPTMGERNRKFGATVDKLSKAGLLKDVPPAEVPK